MHVDDTPNAEPVKVCPQCKTGKPATSEHFHRDKGRKDGLTARCKECARQNTREWYETNKAYVMEWREANKGRLLEYERTYRQANKGRLLEYERTYRQANKERYAAYQRTWRSRHPHVTAAHSAVHEAVRRGDLPHASECDCFMCGKAAEVYHHVDYSTPLEVFPVCNSCHGQWHAANGRVS